MSADGLSRRTLRLRAAFYVLLAAALIAALALLIAIALQNRENGRLLLDCTAPEGECFRKAQARTGEAVGSINDVVILAAACADRAGVDTEAEIRECVMRGLR